jgi:hypothetical protein
VERLNNPERFTMLLGPGGRSYTQPLSKNPEKFEVRPFKLNENVLPSTIDEHISYVKDWENKCGIKTVAYEYHYCIEQWYEPGAIEFAKLIYDDVIGYHANGIKGIIEDASQRTFFPNGFAFYIYATTLFDASTDFDAAVEDYYSHAYGEDWREVLDFQWKLSRAFDHKFLVGEKSADEKKGKYYNPEVTKTLREIEFIVRDFTPFVEAHKNMPYRAQTVSYRILARYLEYCKGLAKALALKAEGKEYAARDEWNKFRISFGKYELEMERCYDQQMCMASLSRIFNAISNGAKDSAEVVFEA